MKYLLSNRQIKELNRGNALQIAIPKPCGFSQSIQTYFLTHVPDADFKTLRRCGLQSIVCNPLHRAQRGPGQIFGEIIKPDEYADFRDHFTATVECIVGLVSDVAVSKSQYPIQWPGVMEL